MIEISRTGVEMCLPRKRHPLRFSGQQTEITTIIAKRCFNPCPIAMRLSVTRNCGRALSPGVVDQRRWVVAILAAKPES